MIMLMAVILSGCTSNSGRTPDATAAAPPSGAVTGPPSGGALLPEPTGYPCLLTAAEVASLSGFNYLTRAIKTNLPDTCAYQGPAVEGNRSVYLTVHREASVENAQVAYDRSALPLNALVPVSDLGDQAVIITGANTGFQGIVFRDRNINVGIQLDGHDVRPSPGFESRVVELARAVDKRLR